jgi:hypothetical protein
MTAHNAVAELTVCCSKMGLWQQGKAGSGTLPTTSRQCRRYTIQCLRSSSRGNCYLEPVGEVLDTPAFTIGMCHDDHLQACTQHTAHSTQHTAHSTPSALATLIGLLL